MTKVLEGVTYRYNFVTDRRAGKRPSYPVKAVVRRFPGMESWHFAYIPVKTSQLIKKTFGHAARGWGSLPVKITLGGSSWDTSIFPDKKAGVYLLPLKASVRKAEGVRAGKSISFKLDIR